MLFVLKLHWVYLEMTVRLKGLTLIWMWDAWLRLKNIAEYSLLIVLRVWDNCEITEITFFSCKMTVIWQWYDSDMTVIWLGNDWEIILWKDL